MLQREQCRRVVLANSLPFNGAASADAELLASTTVAASQLILNSAAATSELIGQSLPQNLDAYAVAGFLQTLQHSLGGWWLDS